jgi:hypothetical protein
LHTLQRTKKKTTCVKFAQVPDNALVAMTLLIAESRPQEKDVITAMLTNLIRS